MFVTINMSTRNIIAFTQDVSQHLSVCLFVSSYYGEYKWYLVDILIYSFLMKNDFDTLHMLIDNLIYFCELSIFVIFFT